MFRPAARLLRLLALLPLAAGAAAAQEGGIEIFAAQTLFDGGTRVSLTHVYERRSDLYAGEDQVPNPQGLRFEEHRLVLGIDHGLTSNLTLSALLPWVSNDLSSNTADATARGGGDMSFLAKWRPYKHDWHRGTFNLSLIGGLEVPTGRTSVQQGGMLLPPRLQPGRGAWNPFAAFATNLNQGRFRADALLFTKWNTEGSQDYRRGNFVALGTGATWRFLQRPYPGPTMNTRLGIIWRHEEGDRRAGVAVANTGLDEVLIDPSLTWHPAPNLDLTLHVNIPIWQRYEGQQLALDVRTFLALGFRF